jgi:hypothetical protein
VLVRWRQLRQIRPMRMRIGLLAACMVAARAPAQHAPAFTLKPAMATLPEEFERINMVRELADGRVLVADISSNGRLVVADFAAGTVRSISRTGMGPGEYFSPPRRLFPLADDSTLFLSGNRPPRWLLLKGADVVVTVPPDSRAYLAANESFGADEHGNVLGRAILSGNQLAPDLTEYRYAGVIANRSSARIDTVIQLTGETYQIRVGKVNDRPFYALNPLIMSTPEAMMMFQDGWTAIARMNPYRVDWRRPDGTILAGAPLPRAPVKMDNREKRALDQRYRRQYGKPFDARNVGFAEFIAPIRSSLLIAAPGGAVAIFRQQWSGAPDTDYDFVDRKGALIGTLTLPWTERLIGFGNHSAYVVVTDEDGIEHLRKHPWP